MKLFKFIRRETIIAKNESDAWKELHHRLVKEKEQNKGKIFVDKFEVQYEK